MDPKPYRQFIESFYNHETIYYSVEDIVAELHTSHDVKVSVRTLARWLQMWEPKRYTRTDDTPELRIRIIALFFDSGLNDKLMLKILKRQLQQANCSGYAQILDWQDVYPRKLRICRPMRSYQLLEPSLTKGTILSYGKKMQHAHFQSLGST
jgi:hypothetical protein